MDDRREQRRGRKASDETPAEAADRAALEFLDTTIAEKRAALAKGARPRWRNLAIVFAGSVAISLAAFAVTRDAAAAINAWPITLVLLGGLATLLGVPLPRLTPNASIRPQGLSDGRDLREQQIAQLEERRNVLLHRIRARGLRETPGFEARAAEVRVSRTAGETAVQLLIPS